MISLYIFKSNARGMQYGMGTYIRELTGALLANTNINLYVINYHNRDQSEFTIDHISPSYCKINIPSPKVPSLRHNQFDEKYATAVINLLSEVIPESGKVVFQMNYIDDFTIFRKLKEKYSYPVISIVHFAQWQQLFNGNKGRLNGLNINNPSNNIEFTLCREKAMYLSSDHIVSVTRYMKDFLISEYGIDSEKIDVIPNGIDFSRFHTISQEEKISHKHNSGFRQEEKIILFSGRIDHCKGIFLLIDAFCKACNKVDDLRLVIVGLGDITACLKRYSSFYGRITFTGFIPLDQMKNFYQIADIGVVTSVYDHCPYTVLEMMAYNVPMIVSRINGLDEILDDEQCFFIDPVFKESGEITFDIDQLADAIINLTRDNLLRNKLAFNSYKKLTEKFTASRMAEEMRSLFFNMTEN